MSSDLIHQLLLALHLVGLAFGLGGAAAADMTLFRTLRTGDRISADVVVWMRSFSQLVWIGLGILTISGIAMFLRHPSTYLAADGFIAKMLFVTVLVINGMFLNFYTTARLTTFNFSDQYQRRGAAWRARKLSFVFGAISTVSWYATLLAATLKNELDLTLWVYIAGFIGALGGAVIGALALESFLSSGRWRKQPPTEQLTIAQIAAQPERVLPTSQTPVPPIVNPSQHP